MITASDEAAFEMGAELLEFFVQFHGMSQVLQTAPLRYYKRLSTPTGRAGHLK
jgi:hypothetical protein